MATVEGQALADKYGMTFFETSAKSGLNVEAAFRAIAERVCESYDLLSGVPSRAHHEGSLPSCIPNLQANFSLLYVQGFHSKVNPNGDHKIRIKAIFAESH
mmetsp:Transcript_14163/g.13984  ORF Transcript_14163/g.13984 Transcript_14163/m.13984 type:complete len:101 (-) Transcript_14163:95-397(-)